MREQHRAHVAGLGLDRGRSGHQRALIAVGLADSFQLFSGNEIDPRIPYSPVMFATGVMLLFSSAVVYELFPSRDGRQDAGEPRSVG